MTTPAVQRKLTAILCADVAGYSRLMGIDPEGTLETLTEFREVFSIRIETFHGRIVNAPGDAILADFGSVVEAVGCAVEIQKELAHRNEDKPGQRRMDFRIGVNLGDVLVKDGDIYGDGVNIAARLEALADPGGISISGSAHEQVKGKLDLEYDYQGKRSVKNIMETVPVYRVLSYPGAAAHRVVGIKRRFARSWRTAALAAGLVVLIGGGAIAAWYLLTQPTSFLAEVKSREPPPLPDKPSLAVLPFVNTGGDPAQAYFSDGMAQEI
ncbi:MAG: adenylate/guanylate cyclase domain-containing protein, partial [bacterium]